MSPSGNSSALLSLNFENAQARIQGPTIATLALAITACVLRFVARRMSKAGLWYDDWLIVPALFAACATSYFLAAWMVQSDSGNLKWRLGEYIAQICWMVGTSTVKYSILAFYWRIFSDVKRARTAIFVLLGGVSCWAIALVVSLIFLCAPISLYWTLVGPGDCQNYLAVSLGALIPHIVTDAILLLLPIFQIWNSQMPTSQIILLCVVFGLGGFVTIIAIVRMVYTIMFVQDLGNLRIDTINAIILGCVELNIAITCACLPSLRPIGSFLADKWTELRHHGNQPMRGKDLLVDMLPRRQRGEKASILPVVRMASVQMTERKRRAEPPLTETEANERPVPEVDAVYTEIYEMNSEEVPMKELGRSWLDT